MQGLDALTDRENQVLALLNEGCTNREIAAILVISEYTVQGHLRSIYGKLGVASRLQAVIRTNLQGDTSREMDDR